jgi:hypothetical protein
MIIMSCKFRLLLPSGLIENREIGKEGGKLQAEEVAARLAAEEKDRPERPAGCVKLAQNRFIVVCAIHCWISISFSMPLLSAHCTALHANRSAPLSSRVLLPLIRILPLTKSPPQRHTCQGGGANPVCNGAYGYNISV